MLTEIEPIEVLPLTVVDNVFTVRLSQLEVDTFYNRPVPENLYALIYRKGADPRCTKVTEQVFLPCSTCHECECTCDRRHAVMVECPSPYLWLSSNDGGGIDYVFEVDKNLWNYPPGDYVVEIIVPNDEDQFYSTMDSGIWDSHCHKLKDCCKPPAQDKACKIFEFCIADCYSMNIDLNGEQAAMDIVIPVDAEELEIPQV